MERGLHGKMLVHGNSIFHAEVPSEPAKSLA